MILSCQMNSNYNILLSIKVSEESLECWNYSSHQEKKQFTTRYIREKKIQKKSFI